MKRAALIAITCVLAACNAPKVVTVTEYKDRVVRDTITAVDSVYVSHVIKEKGDTVWIADTIFKYKYLDKYAYVYVHDSVPYPVEVVKEVRKRNGYDKFVSWGFWVLVILIIVRLAWWVFKTFYLRRQ